MSMHFDLIDLKLFLCIAEENNLTRGAGKAHLSLPAASLRIKNLEQTIGTKLFDRSSQGLTLRPAGLALQHHARQVMKQLENLRGDLQEYAKGIKGHLRILANTTALTEFLPSVLRTFLIEHPDVNIDLQERLSNDIVRAVGEGTTDIGIVAGNVRTDGLDVIPYRSDRLVLATASKHPLGGKRAVHFAETLDYDYIGLPEGSAIHYFLNQAASNLRRQILMRIQVNGFETVCRMIEANIGIGVLPESAAQRYSRNMSMRLVTLRDEWATRNLLICVRELQALPTFAKKLVELLTEDASETGMDNRSRQTRIEYS
jgi:DNA-binding transcriptional LysR family regulator